MFDLRKKPTTVVGFKKGFRLFQRLYNGFLIVFTRFLHGFHTVYKSFINRFLLREQPT